MKTEIETIGAAMPDLQPPECAIDLVARGKAYEADAWMRDRRKYWEDRTPASYKDDFDLERVARSQPGRRPEYDNTALLNRALSWKKSQKGLLLSGPQGRGKTRAVYALCRRLLCDEGIDVAIWHASDFFSALQDNVRYGNDDAAGFIERQSSRPVFFMDDFGQEALLNSRSEWGKSWFFRFLDLRIGKSLPILLTTNQSAEQIVSDRHDTKGDPLVRRLLELADPIKFY